VKNLYDIAVIGAGLVGLTTALACSSQGVRVALIDRDDPHLHLKAAFDGRASAIAASSFRMFETMGIASALKDHIQPIHDILISDGDVGQAASPFSLHFAGGDHKNEPSGYMVENHRLRRALLEAVRDHDFITLMAPTSITDMAVSLDTATITFEDGETIQAALIAAADGRNSFCRKQAGIGVNTLAYKQKAIVTTVKHERPHGGVAHEIFLPNGPFAILPLTDNRANIVWTDTIRAVDAAMALPDDMFASELARRFGAFLGDVEPCAPRWAYPLSLQIAERYVSDRMVLLGDAAHVIHPIAGQGLNMGLRDAAALADIIGTGIDQGLDIGGATLSEYEVWRKFDNHALAGATDIFNRLFSNNIAPIKHARRLGLGLIDKVAPARMFFMKEAAGENGYLPSLLR